MDSLKWSQDIVGIIDAEGPEGRWMIGSLDVANVSFVPALPVGTDERREMYDAWVQADRSDMSEAAQRLGHFFGIGTNDIMFAETVEEATMLVEAMRRGDDGFDAPAEQLAAAGFTIKHADIPSLWTRRIRSGTYDVRIDDTPGRRGVRVNYHGDGAKYWHNVAGVILRSSGQSGKVFHRTYPEKAKDPLRVAVAHAIAVMDARLARGGRFSKPLGKVLKGI